MTLSKNEIKERRGTIGCVIALSIPIILIGGYFIWLNQIANQFGESLKDLSEKRIQRNEEKRKVKNQEVVEGRLIWNLLEFQSFYGLEDSLVNKYQDTIEYYIKNQKQKSEFDKEIDEYLYLKKMNLLFLPCQFLKVNNQKCRIYFSEEDKKRIDETNWLNKNKKEKKHTFIKMKITKFKDLIFYCDEILEINQRLLTPEEQKE